MKLTYFKRKHFIAYTALLISAFFTVNTTAAQVFVTAQIERIMQLHHVAAAALIVVNKDEVLVNAHLGVRDWQSKAVFKAGDVYRIGSISKTFAGLLALRLQAEGKINLADEIKGYGLSPYVQNKFPDQPITLAHLLEHTAGLADLTQKEWDYNQPESITLGQAFELKLAQHPTLWPPVHRSYSNVGAGLFGLALENRLTTSYDDLMQQHVFGPLAMKHSNLLLTAEVKQHLITGYDRDGKTPIPYWHNIYRPFAAINTTNGDMIKWLQMWLQSNDSSFISPVDKKRMGTPTTSLASQHGLDYGYGLGLYQWQTGGHSFFGHGGDADGYLTRFAFNPQSGLGYFVMINAFNKRALNEMVDAIESQIIQDLPKAEYPLRINLDDSLLQKYTGTYRAITTRFTRPNKDEIKVRVKAEHLTYQRNRGRAVNLYAVNEKQFRTADQSKATHVFVTDRGNQYIISDSGSFIKIE